MGGGAISPPPFAGGAAAFFGPRNEIGRQSMVPTPMSPIGLPSGPKGPGIGVPPSMGPFGPKVNLANFRMPGLL